MGKQSFSEWGIYKKFIIPAFECAGWDIWLGYYDRVQEHRGDPMNKRNFVTWDQLLFIVSLVQLLYEILKG